MDKQTIIDQLNALTVDGSLDQHDINYLINYLIANGVESGTPRDLIQIRRGEHDKLPNLGQGELAYTFDNEELFIGGVFGNVSMGKSLLKESTTVMIPSQYPTLQDAIDELSQHQVKQGVEINLLIESGHKLTKAVELQDGDYSKFKIISEDPVVYLDENFVGANGVNVMGETQHGEVSVLFKSVNAVFPTIGCTIDMENKHSSGLLLLGNSEGTVLPGCGIINAGTKGVYVVSSRLWAKDAIFSGSNHEGIRARLSSVVNIGGANFDNCCKGETQNASIFISRSSVAYANDATAINSGNIGVSIHRSFASIESVDASNAATMGLEVDTGSHVIATGANFSNAGSYCARIQRSVVEMRGANLENSGHSSGIALSLRYGAVVQAENLNVSGDIIGDNRSNVTPNRMDGRGLLLMESLPAADPSSYKTSTNNTPDFIGQLCLSGGSTGGGGIFVARGLTSDSWVRISNT